MVEELNMRVLSREVHNLDKILFTIPYAVLASYDKTTQMWTYTKFKGPLFLVQDKLKQKRLVILNQCSVKNFVQLVKHFLCRYSTAISSSLKPSALEDTCSILDSRTLFLVGSSKVSGPRIPLSNSSIRISLISDSFIVSASTFDYETDLI